jgi:hypothetical protein
MRPRCSAGFQGQSPWVDLEIGTRRIVHWDATAPPVYESAVDRAVTAMGVRVLKTLVRTPQASAFL